MAPPRQPVKILYTDLDGTCVHYEGFDDAEAAGLLALPPSTTGRCGAISERTLELYAQARAQGCRLVVLTGARTPTLLQRLAFLPAADAYVSENGGRIFYSPEVAERLGGALIAATAPEPDANAAAAIATAAAATSPPRPVALPLIEDLAWRAQLAPVCGPAREEARGVAPEDRTGPLWAFYRRLAQQGWRVDALGYATAFRVQRQQRGAAAGAEDEDEEASAEAALSAVAASRPAGVACSTNLGVLDFYPAGSGKEGAARRLERLFLAEAEAAGGGATRAARTAFLCDDDNDLALAARCGRAFVPTFGSESMRRAVDEARRRAEAAAAPTHFVTPAPPPSSSGAGGPSSSAARCAAVTEAMIEAATAWLCEEEAGEASAVAVAAPADKPALAAAAR